MVQCATNILTLLTVLLHSFLGCCWHHTHDCCANHGDSASVENSSGTVHHGEAATSHDGCGHGHSGHGHSGHGHSGHGHSGHGRQHASGNCHLPAGHLPQGPCRETCEGDHCIYVPSSEVELPDMDQPICLFFMGVVADDFASSAANYGTSRDAGPIQSPDRANASFTQVWRL